MVEVVFLPGADADYRQALAWYQERSAQAAAGFEAAVEVALRAIGEAPERWPLGDDRHRFYSLRRYPYSIFYRIEAERVIGRRARPRQSRRFLLARPILSKR